MAKIKLYLAQPAERVGTCHPMSSKLGSFPSPAFVPIFSPASWSMSFIFLLLIIIVSLGL